MAQGPNIMATGVGEIRHQQAVLSVCMSPDGTVFSAGCDNKAMMWTPSPSGGAQQPRQIAEVRTKQNINVYWPYERTQSLLFPPSFSAFVDLTHNPFNHIHTHSIQRQSSPFTVYHSSLV